MLIFFFCWLCLQRNKFMWTQIRIHNYGIKNYFFKWFPWSSYQQNLTSQSYQQENTIKENPIITNSTNLFLVVVHVHFIMKVTFTVLILEYNINVHFLPDFNQTNKNRIFQLTEKHGRINVKNNQNSYTWTNNLTKNTLPIPRECLVTVDKLYQEHYHNAATVP